MEIFMVCFGVDEKISISDRCSPADSLLGLAVPRLAEASTDILRACWASGSLTVSTAWSWTSAETGSKCAAVATSVSESETESDTDSETRSFARSGAQDTLPLLPPLLLLSTGSGSAKGELAALAPSLASVSAWALLRFCIVSGGDWTVSCVPVQRGLCSVSWPTLPPGPISSNTPWGMPPPTGVSRKKSKTGFWNNTQKICSQVTDPRNHTTVREQKRRRAETERQKTIFSTSNTVKCLHLTGSEKWRQDDKQVTSMWGGFIWDYESMQAWMCRLCANPLWKNTVL